jgi:hypothetical protein
MTMATPDALPRHAKDLVMRWLCDVLTGSSLRALGPTLPRTVARLSADVIHVDLQHALPDVLFRAEDGSLVHLEFQMTSARPDLRRFLGYDAVALARYADAPRVETVVLYGPRIGTTASTAAFGSIRYTVHAVYLGSMDGAARLTRLRQQVADGRPVTEEHLLELALLPLMGHQRPLPEVIRAALPVLETAPAHLREPLTAAMVALGYAYAAPSEREWVKEMVHAMPIPDEFSALIDDLVADLAEKRVEERAAVLVEERAAVLAEQRAAVLAEQRAAVLAEQRAAVLAEQRAAVLAEQRAAVLVQARVEDARRDIVAEILSARFGPLPPSISEQVARLTDRETVRRLSILAATARTLDEVLAFLVDTPASDPSQPV